MNNDKYQKQLIKRAEKLENSRDDWEAKNKDRYEDIKALKMRLEETQEIRDRWKNDFNKSEKDLKELKQAQAERELHIAL